MFRAFGNFIASGFLWIGSWIGGEEDVSPSSSYSYEEYEELED